MNVITIVESRSMRGQYEVSIKRSGKSIIARNTTSGTGAASAKAVELANGCGGEYQILGDKKVLNEIRSGGIFGSSA